MLRPWPISYASSGIFVEIGSATRADIAVMATVTTDTPVPMESQARRRLSSPRCSVSVGILRSTSMNTTMTIVSTRACVSARSGAPWRTKMNAMQ